MSLYSEQEDSETEIPTTQDMLVELDVGGVRYVTSLVILRSHPGSMLDVMYSGRYNIEEEEGGGTFLDRDGYLFGHVLAYLRDGVLAVGCEHDISYIKKENAPQEKQQF